MKVILLVGGMYVIHPIFCQPGIIEAFKAMTEKNSAWAGVVMRVPERWKK